MCVVIIVKQRMENELLLCIMSFDYMPIVTGKKFQGRF